VDDLKSPVVIIESDPDFVTKEFQNKLLPAGVFTITTGGTTASLDSIPANGLLWQMRGPFAPHAMGIAGALARAEAYTKTVRLTGDAGASTNLKVAAVYSDESSDLAVSANFGTVLRFNGLTADQNKQGISGGPPLYQLNQVPAASLHPNPDYSQQIIDIVGFKPHVIIVVTSYFEFVALAKAIDTQWDSQVPGQPRPFYIAGPDVDPQSIEQLINSPIGSEPRPDAAKRFVKVEYTVSPPDPTVHRAYVNRMTATYFQQDRYVEAYNRAYDAIYWAMYGIIGVRQDPLLTGPKIGKAVRALQGGREVVQPGTDDLNTVAPLIAQANVTGDFQGATGPANQDPASGARPTSSSLTCYKQYLTAGANVTFSYFRDSLIYSPDAGAFVKYQGDFCFPSF
jgi:hypothetical protein